MFNPTTLILNLCLYLEADYKSIYFRGLIIDLFTFDNNICTLDKLTLRFRFAEPS